MLACAFGSTLWSSFTIKRSKLFAIFYSNEKYKSRFALSVQVKNENGSVMRFFYTHDFVIKSGLRRAKARFETTSFGKIDIAQKSAW